MSALGWIAATVAAGSALWCAWLVARSVATRRAMRHRTRRAVAEQQVLTTDEERISAFRRYAADMGKIRRSHGR